MVQLTFCKAVVEQTALLVCFAGDTAALQNMLLVIAAASYIALLLWFATSILICCSALTKHCCDLLYSLLLAVL